MRIFVVAILLISLTVFLDSDHNSAAAGGYRNFLPLVHHYIEPVVLPPAPPLSDVKGIVTLRDTNFDSDVYSMRADGSEVVNLTNTPAQSEFVVAWSPDGTQILYATYDELFLMNSDGTNPRPIPLEGSYSDYSKPLWSVKGDIVIREQRYPGTIYIVRAGTTLVTPLVSNTDPYTIFAWSPDGSKLAFNKNYDEGGEVFTITADGTIIAPITDSSPLITNKFNAWTEGGASLLVNRYGDSAYGIWRIDLNTSTETPITPVEEWAYDVNSVAPDGRKFLYSQSSIVPDEIPGQALAFREMGTARYVSYEDTARCWGYGGCSIGTAVWSSDSNIAAWEYDTRDLPWGVRHINYVIAPFTTPQTLTSDALYTYDPTLISSWLFHSAYLPDNRVVVRAFDVSSGTLQDIPIDASLSVITHDWSYDPNPSLSPSITTAYLHQ